jgi:hypothetical protein
MIILKTLTTRYVLEETGDVTLRDTQDVLYLPSFFTVRGCYAKFCLEKRGISISTTNKGNVKKKAAIDGADVINAVASWGAYCQFWKRSLSIAAFFLTFPLFVVLILMHLFSRQNFA